MKSSSDMLPVQKITRLIQLIDTSLSTEHKPTDGVPTTRKLLNRLPQKCCSGGTSFHSVVNKMTPRGISVGLRHVVWSHESLDQGHRHQFKDFCWRAETDSALIRPHGFSSFTYPGWLWEPHGETRWAWCYLHSRLSWGSGYNYTNHATHTQWWHRIDFTSIIFFYRD